MAVRGGIAPKETRTARDLPRRRGPAGRQPRARSQEEFEGFGPADTESGRAQGMRPPKPARGTSRDPEAGPPKRSDYRPGGALNNPRTTVPSPKGAPAPREVPSGGGAVVSRAGGDVAGFLLSLIGYALVLNYLEGGPAQVRGWLAAKFLNQPYQPAVTPPSAAASPSSPAPPSTGSAPRPASPARPAAA